MLPFKSLDACILFIEYENIYLKDSKIPNSKINQRNTQKSFRLQTPFFSEILNLNHLCMCSQMLIFVLWNKSN